MISKLPLGAYLSCFSLNESFPFHSSREFLLFFVVSSISLFLASSILELQFMKTRVEKAYIYFNKHSVDNNSTTKMIVLSQKKFLVIVSFLAFLSDQKLHAVMTITYPYKCWPRTIIPQSSGVTSLMSEIISCCGWNVDNDQRWGGEH